MSPKEENVLLHIFFYIRYSSRHHRFKLRSCVSERFHNQLLYLSPILSIEAPFVYVFLRIYLGMYFLGDCFYQLRIKLKIKYPQLFNI